MRIPAYFMGVYWKVRQESVEQCADRLSRMLSELATCDRTLAAWYEYGRSREQSLQKRVDTGSQASLLDLLNRGRNRRDSDRTVIAELGFHRRLWNGGERGKEVELDVHCGCYSEWIGNSVIIELPDDLGALRSAERMTAVVASVARAWEPDSGGVMSDAAMKAKDREVTVPFVGWLFYASHKLASQIPPLPPPARVQEVDGLGSIIVVQDEPPDPTNPEHVRNIERVEAALKNVI